MPEPKPELGQVKAVLEDRKRHRAALRTQIREDLELYRQAYKIDLPTDFHMVRTPTSTTVIDRLADRLGSGKGLWHIDPRRTGETEKQRVEDLERATQALWYLARRRSKFNLVRGMAHHGASRGGFCVKVQIDPKGFIDAPVKRPTESAHAFELRRQTHLYRAVSLFPIQLGVRSMENLFPDPDSDGEHDMIEWYRRKVGDLKRNYPHWTGWKTLFAKNERTERGRFGARYTDDSEVEFGEIWTEDWRGAWVDDEWIEIVPNVKGPVPNLYNRPPHFLRYAGFGDPEGRPEERCRSILRPGRDTFISMTRLLSIIDTVSENEAYGATLLKKGDSGNAAFSTAPNAKNEMDDPQAVRSYRPDGLHPQVLQALGVIQAVSEQGSVPSEAIGQQPAQRRGTVGMSGVGAAIVTGQASMIIDPLKTAIEDCVSEVSSFLLYCVGAVVHKELPVYGQVSEREFVQVTLSPALIDGHYGPVFFTLLLKEPEDDYARESAGIQALQAGFPLPFVLEHFFRQENADSMTRTMIARQIAFHPDMLQKYYIPRLIERLQGVGAPSSAEKMPLQGTAAPAGYTGEIPPPPAALALGAGGGPVGAEVPPPMDPRAMSMAGVARGADVEGAMPYVSGP